jgi:hypothetical protein
VHLQGFALACSPHRSGGSPFGAASQINIFLGVFTMKEIEKKRSNTEHLLSDPVERSGRAAEKEETILNFLRSEIFTSSGVLSVLLEIGVKAVEVTLRRMLLKGLVVKDSVQIEGTKHSIQLWGITFEGVMTGLDASRIAFEPLRHHKVGSIKLSTLSHALAIQRCHSWYQSDGVLMGWDAESRLPGRDLPNNHYSRWKRYPDAIMRLVESEVSRVPLEDVNLINIDADGYSIAVEVELTRKTIARYASIIRFHIENIREERYHFVWYFCKNETEAESFKHLFIRVATDYKIEYRNESFYLTLEPKATIEHFFNFISLGSLV